MPGALTSGAVSSDRVDFGSIAAFNNMTVFTVCGFFFPTTRTGGRFFFSKYQGASSLGWNMSYTLTAGNVSFNWFRATTSVLYTTNSTPFANLNTWYGVVLSINQTGPAYNLYTWQNGVLTTATWGVTTAGSGAFADDSAANFRCFNAGVAAPTSAYQGRGGPLALFPGVAFTAAEAQSWCMIPRITVGTNVGRLWRLGNEGVGSQQDYSGNGNAGTVTGATQSDGPPLVYPMSFDDDDSDQILDTLRAA